MLFAVSYAREAIAQVDPELSAKRSAFKCH